MQSPRPVASNKGSFGHVLAIAGSRGKTGAAAMCGMAALRAGAGLVTVASEESAIPVIAGHAAELMTEVLSSGRLSALVANKDVIAIGPGLGTDPETVALVRRAFAEFAQPMVVDADALNALAGATWAECTLIAFPDGRVWINPTGTPAMGTGGTGDILTGMIAGLLGQFPKDPDQAIAAAVYLHGLAGELGAAALTEKCLTATDLLRYLPAALEECARLPHRL